MEEKLENEQNNSTASSMTLLDIIKIFLANRKKIFIVTAIICIISIVLYFFVFNLIYLSTASIKSSSSGGGLLSGLDVGGIPDISGLDDIGLGGSKSAKELAAYEEILNSRRCLEPLILKFGLMERDEYKYMEDAVKDFRENKMKISIVKLAGVMSIGVEDKDPILAKQMVDFLVKQLDSINITLNIQNAKSNREFIENRYYLAKEDLRKSEDSLKSFQFIYGVAPDLQIKASAQSAFTMEAEMKAEEVKLDVIRKILSPDQPEVKMQEAKVNSLKEEIAKIQSSTDLNDLLRLGNSPQIAMAFLRLERDVEIQTKIVTFLLPLFEKAKIDEKRETPTIIILDQPAIAERKIKPKRLTMIIVLTLIAFLCSNLFFIILFKWREFKISYNLSRKQV